jgi:hypothetical protein
MLAAGGRAAPLLTLETACPVMTQAGDAVIIAEAVNDWLAYGLPRRSAGTIEKLTILANKHVIGGLGKRKLRELTAEDVDRSLAEKAKVLSTRTLREVRSILLRAISRAQAREKVKRNVVLL